MEKLGINQGTSGNVSVRVPGGGGFLVTASGVAYDTMTVDQVVYMDVEGGYYGEFLPSSEWKFHYDLHRQVPEALAIVHAHPTFCAAIASQRRGIPAFHHLVAGSGGGEIPCADYATFGTQELSDAIIAARGSSRSVLMANHGLITWGETLEDALISAQEVEHLAKTYVSALSMGALPALLPDEEMLILAKDLEEVRRRRLEVLSHAALFEVDTKARSFSQARRELAEACKSLVQKQIAVGVASCVSCRVDGGFLVTAAGVPLEMVGPQHIVLVGLGDDAVAEGRALAPSAEWRLHRQVYRDSADAQAVVHAQSTHCAAMSAHIKPMPSFHYMVGAISGGKAIACAAYARPGSQALADGASKAMQGGKLRAALLANNGMVCWGPNLAKACWAANEFECCARQYVAARSTGMEPVVLDDAEMDVCLAKFKTYGKSRPDRHSGLSEFEVKHAIIAPSFAGPIHCGCCMPPEDTKADFRE